MEVENASVSNSHEIWNFLEKKKSLALVVGVIMAAMSPVIVVGNTLIVIVVWKDPLKKLRSFTSSYILLSMALLTF